MLNKRIAVGFMSIAGALAIAGGATFAYFSDAVSSTGNTFSSGTLDIQIRDENQGFGDAVTASAVVEGLYPGGDEYVSYLCFRNSGNTPIQEILTKMTGEGNINELSPWINVTKVELGAVPSGECDAANGDTNLGDFTTDFVSRFDGAGGQPQTGTVSLYELLSDLDGTNRDEDDLLDGIAALLPADPNVLLKFRTTWEMDLDAPNTAQAKSVTINTEFVARQDEN